MLPWNESEPGCEIAALAKCAAVTDRGNQRRCGERSNARNREQSAATVVFFGHLGELTVGSVDLLFQLRPFIAKLQQERPHSWREQVLCIFEDRRNLSLQVRWSRSNSDPMAQEGNRGAD